MGIAFLDGELDGLDEDGILVWFKKGGCVSFGSSFAGIVSLWNTGSVTCE